jgi:uncharacterized membrane protein
MFPKRYSGSNQQWLLFGFAKLLSWFLPDFFASKRFVGTRKSVLTGFLTGIFEEMYAPCWIVT